MEIYGIFVELIIWWNSLKMELTWDSLNKGSSIITIFVFFWGFSKFFKEKLSIFEIIFILSIFALAWIFFNEFSFLKFSLILIFITIIFLCFLKSQEPKILQYDIELTLPSVCEGCREFNREFDPIFIKHKVIHKGGLKTSWIQCTKCGWDDWQPGINKIYEDSKSFF